MHVGIGGKDKKMAVFPVTEWPETNTALHRLEQLLHCPLCHDIMQDPCDLDGCDHHFCRACIHRSFEGCKSSCCPECGFPAWVRDIKANRQLDNLIRLMGTMRELVEGRSSAQTGSHLGGASAGLETLEPMETESAGPSSGRQPWSRAPLEASGCEPFLSTSLEAQQTAGHHAGQSLKLSVAGERTHGEGNSSDDVFQKPHIGEQLIRRRLKYVQKVIRSGELSTPTEAITKGGRSKQSEQPPLATVNHRRAKSLPEQAISRTKHLDSHLLSSVESHGTQLLPGSSSDKIVVGSNQENTNAVLSKSFGQPKTRRRKSNPLESTSSANVAVPDFSVQFPFSPLVTKTRKYAKLDSAGRIQRLQEAGLPYRLPSKRPQLSFAGTTSHRGKETAPRHKRVHQLKMEAFIRPRYSAAEGRDSGSSVSDLGGGSGIASSSQRTTSTRVSLPPHPTPVGGVWSRGSPLSESPVPSTPSSAHARTMRRNIRGESPLHIAAIKGDTSAVRALLLQGADPNAKDHAGWTPLHEASNHGYPEVVSLLLDHGALINIPGFENDTPLHDAVGNGHLEVASLLVARGANTNLRNRHGLTPRELAVGEAMKEVFTRPASSPGLLISPNAIRSPHASPVLNGGPSQVVLLATGLKGHQKTQVEEVAELLGAQVVSSFSPEVSHVITACDRVGCCPRTLKFLCAVALGKWIVSFQWISKCLQERSWVDEGRYEVQGVSMGETVLTTEAPRKGRENAGQKAPGLFDGCDFYFSGAFSPPRASKEDLSHLVKLAGGHVLAREPKVHREIENLAMGAAVCPYHAQPHSLFSTCHTFIVYDPHSQQASHPAVRTDMVVAVPASWLLDCLSHFELLDIPQ